MMLEGTMSGVEVGLSAATLRTGWRPEMPLRAWLVGEVGSIHGTGLGLEDSRDGVARWSAVGAGLGWAIALSRRVAIVTSVEGEWVLERARFTSDDGIVLYRSPAAVVLGSLSLEVGLR